MNTKTYEARVDGCRPAAPRSYAGATFSVGIGEVGTRAAAIYRVNGSVRDEEEVDRLVVRLVEWLNNPSGPGAGAGMGIPKSDCSSVKIMLTAAGRQNGWLK